MSATPLTRDQAVSRLTLIAAAEPRSVAERMADIFVARDEDGLSTEPADLFREGFSAEEIAANEREATQIAARRQAKSKTRDVNATREKTVEELTAEMAEAILPYMPADIIVVAELQGRGFSTRQIDFCLPKAKALAALTFAERAAGGMQ